MLQKIIGSTLLLSLIALSSSVSAQTAGSINSAINQLLVQQSQCVTTGGVTPCYEEYAQKIAVLKATLVNLSTPQTTQGAPALSSSQQAWQREREARLIRQENWRRVNSQGRSTPVVGANTGLTDLEIANKRAAEQTARLKVVAANRAARQQYEAERAAQVTAIRAKFLADNEAARQKYERDRAAIAEDRAMAARYEAAKQKLMEAQNSLPSPDSPEYDAAKQRLMEAQNSLRNVTTNGIMVEGANGQRTPSTSDGTFNGNQVNY